MASGKGRPPLKIYNPDAPPRGEIVWAEARALLAVRAADGTILESEIVRIPVKTEHEALLDPAAWSAAHEHLDLLRHERAEQLRRKPTADRPDPEFRPRWLKMLGAVIGLRAMLLLVLVLSFGQCARAQSADELDALRARVERLEAAVFPAEPPRAWEPVTEWLTIRDGKIFEGDREFRAWGVNIVSPWAIGSKPEALAAELDRLRGMGVRLIRVLHWANYQPTYPDHEKYAPALDRFIAECGQRGIRVWLTLHHRQRLTEADGPVSPLGKIALWEKLWSPRPGGTLKGEIADLFFFDPVLEEHLQAFAEWQLDRVNTVTGRRYRDDPTVAIYTIANEKLCIGAQAFATSARGRADLSDYGQAYFARMDEYATATGVDVSKLDKQGIRQFLAWNGFRTYRRLYDHLRARGCRALINASALFGDRPQDGLVEIAAGDLVDVHKYAGAIGAADPAGNDVTLADPLSPDRTAAEYRIASILHACHLAGKPLAIGEVSGVDEHADVGQADSFVTAPGVVARAAAEQGASIVTWYAAHSHEIRGPPAKDERYDAFRDDRFVAAWEKAAKVFAGEALPPRLIELDLNATYGSGKGPAFFVPIPGTQRWALEGAKAFSSQVLLAPLPRQPEQN